MLGVHFLWTIFDVVGTIAFALSGALVGVTRRMDLFGIFVLAGATAIGGGIIRDMMVGNFPPNSLRTFLYLGITAAVVCIVFITYRFHRFHRKSTIIFHKLYLLADALGLASFTVTGTAIGYYAAPQYPVFGVVLGLLTAIGGGIIRDLLAQRIPSVLKEDVYALPALIGGIVYVGLAMLGLAYLAAYLTFIVVFGIRMLAIYYGWRLPKL